MMLRVTAAGCITDANFGRLQKIGWTRASRTDKGEPFSAFHVPVFHCSQAQLQG